MPILARQHKQNAERRHQSEHVDCSSGLCVIGVDIMSILDGVEYRMT